MADGINFTYYDTSNRVPGVYVEMDPSQANTGQAIQSTLIMGQRHGGDGLPNQPYQVQSMVQVQKLAGIDSMLAAMVQAYRAGDSFGDLWIEILDDDPAGVAAIGTVQITGTATEPGTLNVYIAGTLIQAGVDAGDDGPAVAAALHTAINANPYL